MLYAREAGYENLASYSFFQTRKKKMKNIITFKTLSPN